MRVDERLELGGDCRVAAFGEVEVDTRLEGGEAGLVEAGGLDLREGLRREVCERRAAPERERCARIMRGDQPLEPRDVELVRLDADEVARGTRRRSDLPRSRCEARERAPGGRSARSPGATRPRSRRSGGRSRRPRSDGAAAEQAAHEASDRRAAPAVVVVKHLQRPQQAEFQALRPPPRLLKRSLGGS